MHNEAKTLLCLKIFVIRGKDAPFEVCVETWIIG